MLLGDQRKIGKSIDEIKVGDSLVITEIIEDKDLLLYLGLTNDANPLYIQHDYASLTDYKKPIVPSIMLTGIISSTISKHLPGPGSYIQNLDIQFLHPVHHYESIQFLFEVKNINYSAGVVSLYVEATNDTDKIVIQSNILVIPPKKI